MIVLIIILYHSSKVVSITYNLSLELCHTRPYNFFEKVSSNSIIEMIVNYDMHNNVPTYSFLLLRVNLSTLNMPLNMNGQKCM